VRVLISWIDPDDGSISSAVEFPGEAIPAIGDVIVQPFAAPFEIDACEVVERYIYSGDEKHDFEETWHLVLKRVELKLGRAEVFQLPTMIEEQEDGSLFLTKGPPPASDGPNPRHSARA
jgi:hypothetical protein